MTLEETLNIGGYLLLVVVVYSVFFFILYSIIILIGWKLPTPIRRDGDVMYYGERRLPGGVLLTFSCGVLAPWALAILAFLLAVYLFGIIGEFLGVKPP